MIIKRIKSMGTQYQMEYNLSLDNDRFSGVYILYKKNEKYMSDRCIYVGQGDIYKRLRCHCKDKDFDYAIVHRIDNEQKRKYIEAVLIESLEPYLNKATPLPEKIIPSDDSDKLSRIFTDISYLRKDVSETYGVLLFELKEQLSLEKSLRKSLEKKIIKERNEKAINNIIANL